VVQRKHNEDFLLKQPMYLLLTYYTYVCTSACCHFLNVLDLQQSGETDVFSNI